MYLTVFRGFFREGLTCHCEEPQTTKQSLQDYGNPCGIASIYGNVGEIARHWAHGLFSIQPVVVIALSGYNHGEDQYRPNKMYAILADIHSNLTALKAVLEDIERRGGVDEVWCLGDIVGYGPDPHECIDTLRQMKIVNIMGNHDAAAVGKIDIAFFNRDAAAAIRWTAGQLTHDDYVYLNQLPLSIERESFTLVHGSPRDPVREYLHSTHSAEQNLPYLHTMYCLVGHTHSPTVFVFNDTADGTMKRFEPDSPLMLGEDRLIINPGAVGQPRDGDPRASYALLDSDAGTLTLHRVSYDIPAAQAKIMSNNLPASLAVRLNYGL